MRRVAVLASSLVLLWSWPATGQNNGVNEQSFFHGYPLGRGARTWAMGGTEIALPGAVSPTAGNPADLARLTGTVAAFSFGIDNLRQQPKQIDRTLGVQPTPATSTFVEGESGASGGALDFVAVAFTLPYQIGGRPIAAQVSYDRAISFSRDLDYRYAFRQQSSYRYDYDYALAIQGSGGLEALTVSAASEVATHLYVGASLHRWFRGYTFRTTETYANSVADYYGMTGTWTDQATDSLRFDVSGFTVDVGVQYAPRPWLLVGMVWRGGGGLGVDHSSAPARTKGLTGETYSSTGTGHATLDLPSSIGVGVGVRWRGALVGIDHIRTAWSTAALRGYARANANGGTVTPGDYTYPALRQVGEDYQLDAGQTHMGIEYPLKIGTLEVPVRAGFFLQDAFVTTLEGELPTTFGVTAGVGVAWRKTAVDIAWIRSDASREFVRDTVRVSMRYSF